MTEGACFFVVWALPGGGGGGGGEDNGPTTGARGHDYDAFGLLDRLSFPRVACRQNATGE
jgi:hypothetical protein